MNNKLKHIYADWVCVIFLAIGLVTMIVKEVFVLSVMFVITGTIGMIINEALNPFENEN